MLDPSASSDDALIRASARGDRDAFAALAARHAPAVLRLARAVSASEAEADDVVQEAFTAAFRAAATFDPSRGSVRTWLFAIARNEARRTRRRGREIPTGDAEPSLLGLGLAAGWGHDAPEDSLSRAERTEQLARAIASLGPEDREVLVLRDLEELSGEATSAVLGVSLAAMKSRLHRARLRLLAALQASEGAVVAHDREVGGIRCTGVLALLGDYVDGELPAPDVALVDAHLRGCTVCERFGGRYGKVVQDVREQLGRPPAIDPEQLTRIRGLLRG